MTAPRVPRQQAGLQPPAGRLPPNPQPPAARPVAARFRLLAARYGWEAVVLLALAVVLALPSLVRYF